MALIPRIKLQANVEDDLSVSAAVAELGLIAERTTNDDGNGGVDFIITDTSDTEGLYDLVLASLERAVLTSPVILQYHKCPHVSGFEEESWMNCTDAQYEFSSVVVN